MKILLIEYAVAVGNRKFLKEGKAMLDILVKSFFNLGHEVSYLSNSLSLKHGIKIYSNEDTFEEIIEKEAKSSDAGLIIAPDEILSNLTAIIEKNTTNLGSPSNSIQICADKLLCTKILMSNGIQAPKIIEEPTKGKYVIKPQFGCGSDGVYLSETFELKKGCITTEYIEGEHISVSLISNNNNPLSLTINKQLIEFEGLKINYNGNIVPFKTKQDDKIYNLAIKVAKILGCNGYLGIDMIIKNENQRFSETHAPAGNVLSENIYVVDVNPRPTTSLFGISKVMKEEIGDLLLKNLNNSLPNSVEIIGNYSFTKEDII